MAQKRGPVPGVYESHGRYYRAVRVGPKKVWLPLTRVADGLAALHRALADLHDKPAEPDDSMRKLIESWQAECMPRLAAKTQRDAQRINLAIGAAMPDHRACDVTTPDAALYLRDYAAKPRTYNAHRSQLRELMRHAELLGWRPAGSNPTQAIRTMRTPARTRYITDSELRRIKIGAMRGNDGLATDSGPMLCALLDVLYLTGQPIGDVLALDAADAAGDLLHFRRAKVAKSTGASVRVRVTPRLRDALNRLLAIREDVAADVLVRLRRPLIEPALIVTRSGSRARYDGIKSAWYRACERAGIEDATIHDLRAKALTDIERSRGMRAARVAGQHRTEGQTADYVRARAAEIVDATR